MGDVYHTIFCDYSLPTRGKVSARIYPHSRFHLRLGRTLFSATGVKGALCVAPCGLGLERVLIRQSRRHIVKYFEKSEES